MNVEQGPAGEPGPQLTGTGIDTVDAAAQDDVGPQLDAVTTDVELGPAGEFGPQFTVEVTVEAIGHDVALPPPTGVTGVQLAVTTLVGHGMFPGELDNPLGNDSWHARRGVKLWTTARNGHLGGCTRACRWPTTIRNSRGTARESYRSWAGCRAVSRHGNTCRRAWAIVRATISATRQSDRARGQCGTTGGACRTASAWYGSLREMVNSPPTGVEFGH